MNNNKKLRIEETFNLAVKNHQESKTDIAQKLYNQILKIDPHHSQALNNIAVIFINSKDYQKAKTYFEKAIEINPNYAEAHNNLGLVFRKLEEPEKAKTCFEKAIEINPNYAEAHNNLGIIFNELGEYQKEKDCYEKVIRINPNQPETHNNLGIIFQKLGEYQKAKNYYEKAIYIKPNYVEAHYNLGIVLEELGRFAEAEVSYRQAIELKPDHLAAYKNLGILLKQKILLSKIELAKKYEIKTSISFLKKNDKNLHKSDLRLTSNPFISNRKVEPELISRLYKVNSKKLDDVDPGYLRYGNGRSSDYELFENNISTIKTVEKDLINIMKETVKSDIFIMESFFNIFQTGSGIIFHNHINNFDVTQGLLDQKFSLTYYLDIGDQSCDEPGTLKLQDPDREILPSEGMIVIFPASRKHSATYGGKKDRVMIGVNFYSLI